MHDKVSYLETVILDLNYETERQDEWMILDTIAATAKERPVDNRGFVKGFRCAGYTM